MNDEQKVRLLQRQLTQAEEVKGKQYSDAQFVAWRDATTLALIRIFGEESFQFKAFNSLEFTIRSLRNATPDVNSSRRKVVFERDLQISTKALESYITDFEEQANATALITTSMPQLIASKKVFISHASANKDIVGELIEMLKQMGLRHGQIFCTSFPEYSIPLGVNYLDWLKKELTENSLVLFLFSHDFYQSPVCLSEMGATWALSKEHVPILVPPFTYDDIKGPFPLSQGMVVTEKFKYNDLANIVERLFELPTRGGDWERSRDTIIARIEGHILASIEARRAKEPDAVDRMLGVIRETRFL